MKNLYENKDVRNKNIEKTYILEKVKRLACLGSTDYLTVNLVARYYDVSIKTIQSVIRNHNEELVSDGIKVLSGKEVEELFGDLGIELEKGKNNYIYEGEKIAYSKNTLIPKRAVLRIGMLLQRSEVAKEIRTMLLDNHEQLSRTHTILKQLEELDRNIKSIRG